MLLAHLQTRPRVGGWDNKTQTDLGLPSTDFLIGNTGTEDRQTQCSSVLFTIQLQCLLELFRPFSTADSHRYVPAKRSKDPQWANEEIEQREQERVGRCLPLAAAAHKELESVLPEDICPTFETVLGYTEFVSLGDWHLFESNVHAHARIVENFLLPQGNN